MTAAFQSWNWEPIYLGVREMNPDRIAPADAEKGAPPSTTKPQAATVAVARRLGIPNAKTCTELPIWTIDSKAGFSAWPLGLLRSGFSLAGALCFEDDPDARDITNHNTDVMWCDRKFMDISGDTVIEWLCERIPAFEHQATKCEVGMILFPFYVFESEVEDEASESTLGILFDKVLEVAAEVRARVVESTHLLSHYTVELLVAWAPDRPPTQQRINNISDDIRDAMKQPVRPFVLSGNHFGQLAVEHVVWWTGLQPVREIAIESTVLAAAHVFKKATLPEPTFYHPNDGSVVWPEAVDRPDFTPTCVPKPAECNIVDCADLVIGDARFHRDLYLGTLIPRLAPPGCYSTPASDLQPWATRSVLARHEHDDGCFPLEWYSDRLMIWLRDADNAVADIGQGFNDEHTGYGVWCAAGMTAAIKELLLQYPLGWTRKGLEFVPDENDYMVATATRHAMLSRAPLVGVTTFLMKQVAIRCLRHWFLTDLEIPLNCS